MYVYAIIDTKGIKNIVANFNVIAYLFSANSIIEEAVIECFSCWLNTELFFGITTVMAVFVVMATVRGFSM